MPDPTDEDLHLLADMAATPASGFRPVVLDAPLDRTLRQTWLRHYNGCPRSAYLASKYEGLDSTAAMQRGSAAHAIFAKATRLAMEMNEPIVPPDVVKTLVDEVLAEYAVPFEEHDYIREMAFRWGSEAAFDPQMIVACESLFEMQVGDWKVRARIDFAELIENDRVIVIRDYKSSRAAPPYDEVARKMPDGRLVAKNFQLVLYALLMRYGVPVLEHEGQEFPGENIAGGVNRFDLEFVYPGLEDREGKMVRRPLTLDLLELEEYRSSLEGLLARVAKSEASGDWPAVVSDAACSECPAPAECPIPYEVRDHRGQVNSPEQAADAARVLDRLKATNRAMQTELRNFAKVHGPIRFDGKVMELVYAEHESFDHKGFAAALARGDDVLLEDFLKSKGRTDFRARDLTSEEREAEDV